MNHISYIISISTGGAQIWKQTIGSPPARWGLLDFIRALFLRLILLLLLLLDYLSSSSSSSSSPPPSVSPRPCLHQLPPALPPCQLFAKLFANSLRRLSAPRSLPTSQLSVHRWTSTWDLPSSVCTAEPQPGTVPAQCAPLDLNLGSAQLSVHRWTSAGDLPSSVCTARPQPVTCPAQCAPLDLNGQIECQKICQIECQKICQIKCHEMPWDAMRYAR